MAHSLVTSNFRTHIANQLKESITEPSNTVYYVFAGKSTSFAEANVPTPQDTVQTTFYNAYSEMVFGKRITDSDMYLMVPKVEWQTNTIYTAYDSNTAIFGNNFYVAVNATSKYDIFKVLDNNNGIPSTSAPDAAQTSADDDYYSTNDGYVWKYMYTVTSNVWNKFVTSDFMPVKTDANVAGNAVSGSIDVVRVTYGGSGYTATLSNTFSSQQIAIAGNPYLYDLPANASSNNEFYTGSMIYIKSGSGAGQYRKITNYNAAYKRITIDNAFTTALSNTSVFEITPYITIRGDGNGAAARALVNATASNSIYKIEILNKGSGYSYATTSISGNTGGISNSAVLVPVLSPQGGHGSNAEEELGATAICFGINFSNNETGRIPTENDYRTIGILKDPLFANVALSINTSSLTGGVYTVGEKVTQSTTNASGVVVSFSSPTLTLSNVSGTFTSGLVVSGQTSNAQANLNSYTINGLSKDFTTFDQRTRLGVQYISGTFQLDEKIYQSDEALANAYFHSNNVFFNLTNVKGTINTGGEINGTVSGAVANVISVLPPDLVKYSGDVIYIENTDPISRSNTQTETIKIVLKF